MLKDNSKKIEKGDTFIAVKGFFYDGHDYIEEAIKNGATTIICEKGNYCVDTIIVKDTKFFLKEYLKLHCPKLKFIGITGTNGKTTTAFLIYNVLNLLNIKCAYIGTIGFYLEDKVSDLKNTTPGMLELYNFFELAYEKSFEYVVLEVSSHALEQERCDFIDFDYAIFTNLTQDHLDYHKNMENYALAKQRLFKDLNKGINIINNDSKYSKYFKQGNYVTYGFCNSDYVITLENGFKINNEEYNMSLIGKHNVYNMTCVIILLKLLNIDEILIKEKIKILKSPIGRMDLIDYKNNKIIIDYAHTPDALLNIITSISNLEYNNLYLVFGCGGNRDKSKRSNMGIIATNMSDYVILTNDNPRDEDPNEIVNDIISKVDKKNFEIVLNREKAIERGIQLLKNNDILMVLGKGHENYQIFKDKTVYFSDHDIVNKCIRR